MAHFTNQMRASYTTNRRDVLSDSYVADLNISDRILLDGIFGVLVTKKVKFLENSRHQHRGEDTCRAKPTDIDVVTEHNLTCN